MSNSSMPWVKLYTDFLDDRKTGRLPDILKLRFIQLILVAGECDAEGYLIDSAGPMTIDDIAWRLRIDEEGLKNEIAELTRAGLLGEDDDTGALLILNFAKRQGRSQSVKREQWRKAQDKKRSQDDEEEESHTPVIHDNDMTHTPREEERREEEIKDSDAEASTPANPPKETKSPKHPARMELVKYFLQKTGLPAPRTITHNEVKAAQRLWWSPADEIYELAQKDVDIGKNLIDRSLERLAKDKLTICDLNSILKTARAIYGESNRGPMTGVYGYSHG